MNIKLQNILFPDKDRYMNYQTLFCREGKGIYDDKNQCLVMAKYTVCDFCSYLNGFSVQKWKEYTNIGKVSLKLEVEGEFELIFRVIILCNWLLRNTSFLKRGLAVVLAR